MDGEGGIFAGWMEMSGEEVTIVGKMTANIGKSNRVDNGVVTEG